MLAYLSKILLTSLIILVVTELAKKNMALAAIFASIPVVSILSMIIMYGESKDVSSIVTFSNEIVWLILPSITLFLLFPILIKFGLSFYLAIIVSMASTVISYLLILHIKSTL